MAQERYLFYDMTLDMHILMAESLEGRCWVCCFARLLIWSLSTYEICTGSLLKSNMVDM